MRAILLPVVSVAALVVGGAGVATAEGDDLPSFCTGEKDGKEAEITCETPEEDMKWIGFVRCTTPWHGGSASWWQRSQEVQGSATVHITCNDEGAPEVEADLLSWGQV